MGAVVAVLVFSQFSLLVSFSVCITGAIVGVGLCNGTYKAVNWQRIGLLVTAWLKYNNPDRGHAGRTRRVTVGLFLNAPHFAS